MWGRNPYYGDLHTAFYQYLFQTGFGVFAAISTFRLGLDWFRRRAAWVLLLAYLSTGLTFIPGENWNTYTLDYVHWGSLAVAPDSFLLFAIILWTAALSTRRRSEGRASVGSIAPIVPAFAIAMVTSIFQHNTTPLFVIFVIVFITIAKAAGVATRRVIGVATVSLIGVELALIQGGWLPYQRDRLAGWIHPTAYALGSGYEHSIVSGVLSAAGPFGQGINSTRVALLPNIFRADFLATLTGRFGLFGLCAITVAWIVFFYRTFQIRRSLPNDSRFEKILVAGLISWFLAPVVMTFGSLLGVLPTWSVEVPFMTGGLDVVFYSVGVALLIEIARHHLPQDTQGPSETLDDTS